MLLGGGYKNGLSGNSYLVEYLHCAVLVDTGVEIHPANVQSQLSFYVRLQGSEQTQAVRSQSQNFGIFGKGPKIN